MKEMGVFPFKLLIIIFLTSLLPTKMWGTGSFFPLFEEANATLNRENGACFRAADDSLTKKQPTGQDVDKKKKKKEKPENRTAKLKGKVSFETFERNYERAMRYYQNQQYLSAARLFEELYPLSMGTRYADSILFTFADSYFQNGDFEMSAFHYKDYTRRFPGTERTEEAHFKCVKAIYNLSPYYSLDQFETTYAIEEIDIFIQSYPRSKYVTACNTMLDELREKLARKDFEIIKLYYNTDNYQAAQIAVKNFLKEYSYSVYAPEALYILTKNNLEYAKKSVSARQEERYRMCIEACEMLSQLYPESAFVPMAQSIIKDATQSIKKIELKNRK